MSFPATRNTIDVRMYCAATTGAAQWRSLNSDVLWRERITVGHGAPDESPEAPPSSCSFVLKDASGNYSTRNPLGIYYTYLGLGTPIEVRVEQASETFATTVVDGWASQWTLSGTAANFDQSAGVGTMVVPAATNVRLAYLAAQAHADVDVRVTWSMAVAITGAAAQPALVLRGLSTSDYLMARVDVAPAGTISLGIFTDDPTTIAAATVISGLTYAAGTDYSMRFMASGRFYAAKVWQTSAGEPLDWQVSGYQDTTPKYAGWVGVRAATATGNTNASLVVSFKDFVAYSDRFVGEISSLTQGRDTSGKYKTVAVEANGLQRRISSGQEPTQSALRRGIPSVDDLVAYWPLEDGEDSSMFASAVDPDFPLAVQSATFPSFASNSSFSSSAPLPALNNARFGGVIPAYDETINGSTQMRWIMKIPSTGTTNNSVVARIWGTGTSQLWQITYQTGGGLTLEAYNTSLVNLPLVGASIAAAADGKLLRISLLLDQAGANVDWSVLIYEQGATGYSTTTGTLAGATIGRANYLDFGPQEDLGSTVIGHVTVQSSITSFTDVQLQFNAYETEPAGTRFTRLCLENDVPSVGAALSDSAAMGAQRVDTLLSLLQDCAAADMGSLYDSRAVAASFGPALEYRTLRSAFNQSPLLTLSLAAGQIAPAWVPVDDDQRTFNDVTAERTGGSSYRAVLETGAKSILPPTQGGIGRRETTYKANVASDLQIADVAGWQLALGTQDDYRYPLLTVNLGSTAFAAAGLGPAALSLFVDDLVRITAATGAYVYDDIDLLVQGYTEVFDSTSHVITYNCTTAVPYDTAQLDTDPGYLDADSTVLYATVQAADTSLVVWSRTESWTTTVPYPLMVAGERMSVTACTAATPTLIAATAAVHASNASVTPTMPVGVAAGNLLLILAAIRNSGAGTPDTPSGYTLLADASNFRLFGKIHSGSEVAPTITFTGGVANATTSAQMAALTNVLPLVLDRNTQLNGSAQNIGIVPPLTPNGAASCVLMCGWKQDDWTSVATLSGMTEIAEPSSTTGDDQGFVWDVLFCDGFTIGPDLGGASSFVVTGGVSAISRSIAITMPVSQTMTVTRAVNGVSKIQAADVAIHVADVARLAL